MVPERLARVRGRGNETLNLEDHDDVKAWIDDILPLLTDEDPLGVDTFATHHVPLTDAPSAYEHFQKKEEGMVKVVFNP